MEKERAKIQTWLSRYHWAQPWINRYLPHNGFQTLLLLIGLVMTGVAIKGLFLFLQEVLVADVMQLTLFDIRNHFYRRTMALDLSSFGDQGSAELISRFTNDMDSLGQGLNTLLSKVIREPLRIISCLGIALWLNWRLTCLALVLVPVSALTANRAGQIMKRAVRRSLESMSNIYKILQETFQGIVVVKAYTMERRERRRFFLETKSLYKKSVQVAKIDALSDPVLEMLALSTVSIALLAGSYLVLQADDLPRPGPPQAPARLAADGDRGPALPLRDARRHLRPGPQAGQRPLADPARRGGRRPDLRPDGPRSPRWPTSPRPSACRGIAASIEFDEVGFSYNGRDPVLQGLSLTRPARRDDRPGRPQRLRQVDPDEPAAPVLGRPVGRDPDRRPRPPRRPAPQPPQPDRHGDPGDDPVRGHDRQQHRLRQPPRRPRGDRRRGEAVVCPPVHLEPCPTATTR